MRSYQNYRKYEIEQKINHAGFAPLDVMVTGVTDPMKKSL